MARRRSGGFQHLSGLKEPAHKQNIQLPHETIAAIDGKLARLQLQYMYGPLNTVVIHILFVSLIP